MLTAAWARCLPRVLERWSLPPTARVVDANGALEVGDDEPFVLVDDARRLLTERRRFQAPPALVVVPAPTPAGALQAIESAYDRPVALALFSATELLAVSTPDGPGLRVFSDAVSPVVDRFGTTVADGGWGRMAETNLLVRRLDSDAIDVSVAPAPVRFRSGEAIRVTELHALLSTLPLVAYRFRQSAGVTRVDVVPDPQTDAAELDATLRLLLEPQLERLELAVDANADAAIRGATIEVAGDDVPEEVFALWAPHPHHPATADAVRFFSDAGCSTVPLPVKDGGVLLGSKNAQALESARRLFEGDASANLSDVALYGVQPESATKPLIAQAPSARGSSAPIAVDDQRCNACGDCVDACPVSCIELSGALPVIDASRCVHCHLCSETCPTDALRPYLNEDALLMGRALELQKPLLVQLRRPPPEPVRQPWKKSTPRPNKPPVVLGLATVTLMEHTAALMIGGELVAVVEEERVKRERHYAWKAPNRPGASLASDPTLPLDASWPQGAMNAVLRMAGLTLDDVDAIGINGMPYRMRHSFDAESLARPPRIGRAGRLYFLPHHLCHAASVLGVSDFDDAWILTVDGRGDRETAALWRLESDRFTLVDHVPFFPDRSFGGVYETVTRALGFNSHGQGSTMALAALGDASIDFSDCLHVDARGRVTLSEWRATRRFAANGRLPNAPLTQAHKDLAASAQLALETSVLKLLEHGLGGADAKQLGLAGGVTLNCRMNGVIRRAFPNAQVAVPPGANDAGTAVGAAILAHREFTGELVRPNLGHANLGPGWDDAGIERTLSAAGVPFRRLDDVAQQTAELLAQGSVVCWMQGRMEYGPRALGGRSILADPRRVALKERLNRMKSRQSWRPFGSSILAGHEHVWFEDDWDTRFMLFAVQVRPEKRDIVPVVTHFDGSTRPQVVHADVAPRYHALISAFHARTGVPMVVNTSFNRGGEPIVMTPVDALKSFAGLGADALVIGSSLVTRDDLRRRSR